MKNFRTIFLAGACMLLCCAAMARKEKKGLKINSLTNNCYVYTTYGRLDDGSRYPSNSMYVVTAKGIVMIDVPWDTTQTERFLRLVERKHHKKVIACISTHFHADRTAGLNILKRHGIKTYATVLTTKFCRERNEQQAEYLISADTTFDLGDCRLQTFYPGKGHAPDNIVIWLPESRVLYGGCFVKSTDAEDLGNLGDASPAEWPLAIKKVTERYPVPAWIIPGHGSWAGTGSLEHTLKLLKEYAAANKMK